MGWRSSHGARRNTNGPVRIEVMPADEMSKPNAEDMDARLEERARIGRPFEKGNKAAAGRRPKLARLGITPEELDHKDPVYAASLRYAETYRRRRVCEMRISHGFVSVAAMGIMATSALQLAISRMMMHKGGETLDLDMMKKGSSLANDSRQNELAAWELCSREASAKTRLAANATPWLAHQDAKPRVTEKPEQQEPELAAWEEAEQSAAHERVEPK